MERQWLRRIFHINGNRWLTASILMAGDSCSVVDIYNSDRVTLSTKAKRVAAKEIYNAAARAENEAANI